MQYIYKIFIFSVVLFFTACNFDGFNFCKNTCPPGQKPDKDCVCQATQKMPATEVQQKEILQLIISNDEQNLAKAVAIISPDSPFNLELLQDQNSFKNLYANNIDIFTRLSYQKDNLTLISLLAPLNNFNEVFKTLLQNGADPNFEAFSGLKPLEIAIVADQGEKVKMLLDAGAQINFEGENNILIQTLNLERYKALYALSTFAKEKQIPFEFPSNYFTQAMIDNQIDLAKALLPLINKEAVNTTNNFGVLPLVQAAFLGNIGLMDTLLANGADMELKDQNLRTPLLAYLQEIYIAQIEGNFPMGRENQITETVKHFLEKGADVTATDSNGENIMFYAVRGNNKPLIELLTINYNQNLNPTNNQGETPLFIAAQNTPALVPYFLSKGANPKVMDQNGRTPAIAAVELGNMEIYDLLENAAARRL